MADGRFKDRVLGGFREARTHVADGYSMSRRVVAGVLGGAKREHEDGDEDAFSLTAELELVRQEKAFMQEELDELRARLSAGGGSGRDALDVLMAAKRTAEDVVAEARAKAAEILQQARQRHDDVVGGLEAQRKTLMEEVEELQAFEREYFTRLRAYVRGQLRELTIGAPPDTGTYSTVSR